MEILKGVGASGGIAFGKFELLQKEKPRVQRTRIENTKEEILRFESALSKASHDLKELYEKALEEVGEENAMIFDIHLMMLSDEDYINSIRSKIEKQNINAEASVATTSDSFAEMFSSMHDSYMQARATDVKDISDRLINILTGSEQKKVSSKAPSVIIAEDMAPSETVQLDKSSILAFVTEKGSSNSHTSILARTMGIPAVIGVEGITNEKYNGMEMIVDGFTGEVYLDPTMEIIIKMQEKRQKAQHKKELLNKLKGLETITKDGKRILLYANIGSIDDMVEVYANDAMGVGLFRSEFLYLESKTYPTEDEQFSIYKKIAEKALGKRVIIRTLDIGADKQIDYFEMPKEENPALGMRAIRLCLTRPAIFKTQLKALYRASAFGKISIMFPMITSVSEIQQIKKIISEVKNEIKAEGVLFNEDTEIGIMIETPASAIISDLLAKEVDFFSIGTNDLVQYTLCSDRQNSSVEKFCDPKHLSVLRLIKSTIENAHKEGIWVGICGELASDPDLTELFLSMDVDELSVSPGYILPLKKTILETDISKIKDIVLKDFDLIQ